MTRLFHTLRNVALRCFPGSDYYRLGRSSSIVDSGYPRRFSLWNLDHLGGISAGFQWQNGRTYFFSQGQYVRFDDNNLRVSTELHFLSSWRRNQHSQQFKDVNASRCIIIVHLRNNGNAEYKLIQWNLPWKTTPLATKMWSVKTGGLWWQVQFYWNVGPSAKIVCSLKTGGLSFQWSQDRLHCIGLYYVKMINYLQISVDML